ncbi:hypothetical protein MKD41_04995 [Lutibacter sp. A64]|uniref:hypothetical protein n=1 Tax=Lutibacter sp. A64 TaxID=2918526 RepID=UPI001F061FD4|nr:hypothetical protein [Lutibacter sp. A64]UMB54829.1 hypothetical protein MKD41_04995 [Lutibacter sp. A64]
MRKIITLLLTMVLLSCNNKQHKTDKINEEKGTTQHITSVNEKFKELNPETINVLLKSKNGSVSANEVMKIYYPHEVTIGEGNESIEISEAKLENGNTLVTLVHDNLLDDSIKAKKIILELKNENNRWFVVSIKNNWKCRVGRGHTDWGIELCN